MQKKSERRSKLSPPENWQEFQIYFNEIIKLCKQIITDHNHYIKFNGKFKAHYSLDKIKSTLDTVKKFESNLPVYQGKFNSETEWVALEVNMMVLLIQLYMVLQSRTSFLSVVNRDSRYKTKAYLEESLHYVNKAIEYREKHTKDYASPFEPELEIIKENILATLSKYLPIKNPNKIDSLLISARNDKDINRAYETFDKARESTGDDYFKKFMICTEQAEFYFIKNNLASVTFDKISQADIDHYDNCLTKSTKPLVIASILITLDKIINNRLVYEQCPSICDKLFIATRNLYDLSKFTKDLDCQITLLKHANTNLTWSINLSKKINYKVEIIATTPFEMQELITTRLKCVELAKENKLKEFGEKNLQEAELEKCLADYDEKFTELLKQYEPPKKILKKPTVVKVQTKQSSNKQSASSSSSSEIEEVQIATPKTNSTFIESFDLDYQLKLLEDAIKEENSAQQIFVATGVGRHYQSTANDQLAQQEYNSAIENLKLAIEYFNQAYQLLAEAKPSAASGNAQKEIVLRKLLQKTNNTLSNTLAACKEIQDRFEQSRIEAKKYIIKKYGPEAWYKTEESGRPKSKNAEILEDTKQKVALLERMQKRFQQNFQIQSEEPPKIAANLVAHSIIFQQEIRGNVTQDAPVTRPVI